MPGATPPGGRRRSIALASLTGVLILVDGALLSIGLLVASGHRRGSLSGAEAATFILVGVSAAIGMAVLLLGMIAFARGSRGQGIAKLASALAWLRMAGVLIALPVIVNSLGISAIAGPFETFGAAMAVFDALIAVFVTSVAKRRTRHG